MQRTERISEVQAERPAALNRPARQDVRQGTTQPSHPRPLVRGSCEGLPGEPPDPERIDRILGKLGPVWSLVPNWPLAWLIANLVPSSAKVSDAEIERELDRLLGLGLG